MRATVLRVDDGQTSVDDGLRDAVNLERYGRDKGYEILLVSQEGEMLVGECRVDGRREDLVAWKLGETKGA